MASVIGLSPIRPDLKGRLRELLCIHGLLAWGHQLVPEVGIAPTSPRLQRGANLSQLLGVRLRAPATARSPSARISVACRAPRRRRRPARPADSWVATVVRRR